MTVSALHEGRVAAELAEEFSQLYRVSHRRG